MSSLLIHAAGVALLFTIGASPIIRRVAVDSVQLIASDLREYLPRPAAARKDTGAGGGGGGARQPLPASYGKLPKPAPRQFVSPSATPVQAELIVPPSIVVPAGIPELQASNWGDSLALNRVPSNGPGCCSGIGNGKGTGVGDGDGSGAGPGRGGGIGGGAFRIGGGVSAPVLVYKIDPEYSEEARKAKFHGTVVMSVVVDESGRPREIRVTRAVGLGLDEKAIEAVRQWRFQPGRRAGKPVPVFATVEVNFRLL
jgi:TonB family protein